MKEIQEHKIKIYEFPETDDEEENKLVKKIKVRISEPLLTFQSFKKQKACYSVRGFTVCEKVWICVNSLIVCVCVCRIDFLWL